ncbi:putative trans-sialidase, Group VI [Trypanosoma cruzi]|nr:putative trans-sialidase, Group VI [Trypanosoma cruzi]
MLSRVAAAVKAPRTHNRRRVTGSRGRRREGRESEPPRPNMSRHLFYSAVLLLVLVMMCCGSGTVTAQGEVQESRVPTFEWKSITEGVTVVSLGAPGLLKVGSDVFAVAEAQCTTNTGGNSFTGIASQLLTIDNADKPMEVLNGAEVKTQFLEDGTSEDPKKVDVSRPTTVVKGSDIYMLVGKNSRRDATDQEDRGAEDCGLLLVKGKAGDESSDSIIWGDTSGVPCVSTVEEEKVGLTRLIGGGGSGVKMHDDTLVFPVEGTKEESGKTVSLLIYTSEDNAASWKLSKGIPDGGCSDPSVVEWGEKDKKLIMMTACDGGRRRVYESGDMGDSWTEALGTLSRVWFNKQGEGARAVRSGFITATIGDDNRNVMLVTLPVYPEEDGKKEKGELHLWLTDNTHIVDIGPVSGKDDAAASSLLYKSAGSGDNKQKEELIALYEKKKGDGKPSNSLWSVLLTAKLQRVKDVLATWKKVDETVSKLCPSSDARDGSPGNACSPTVKITDGLVGFLSGNFSENTWKDEYLGVNATVNNNDGGNKATLHEGSVKFTGAWAEWPVGSQGENQLYHFANYNFTLVATVSIDNVPKEEGDTSIPLLGVKVNDDNNPVLLGLSYKKEKKRIVFCGGGQNKEHSSNWEPGTTHQLAIVLQNEKQGSAYVDGQPVLGDAQCDLINTKGISHFYIGGDGNSAKGAGIQDVSVTVANVLLYNRPLSTAEIGALNPNKASIPKAKDAKTVKVNQPEESNQASLKTETPSSHVGQQQTEQVSLRKSENKGSGGLSTSAASSATSSPAVKESEDQSALGTFPEGHSNLDVDSSSEEVQTVDAETGDTVQEDGTQQPSVGTSAAADTNAPTAETMAHDGTKLAPEVGAHSGEDGETVGGTDGQKGEDIHARDGEVKAAALSSSLGNVSQGNNSDAGTVRGSGLLPSLLLLLGLWVFAAL